MPNRIWLVLKEIFSTSAKKWSLPHTLMRSMFTHWRSNRGDQSLDVFTRLVVLTSRFEATRGLFWDGPSDFEPRSDDEDDT
ncbi:hypothetical protein AVEN_123986-1 [Araneus ventricosus]|uniref:Uncharacterized protein n=1 Tax=Araneus ventricosus TaxID=182803 RepID=A0A4Y2D9V8_ARAVE|nr:hypothetical protein AVEN_123986-1 [Araneus ventricosus]